MGPFYRGLAEKASLLSAGLSIVLVKEEGSSHMLGGKSAGVADAQHADAVAKALGMPGIPIYFACDFDATPGNQTAINNYLDGAASVIGRERVGIYGGFYPVKRALDAGKAKFAWQTYAWSGGQWDQRAHIRQTLNGAKVDGASVDIDTSEKDDFGQWPRPGGAKPPAKSDAGKSTKPPASTSTSAKTTADQFAAPTALSVSSKALLLRWDAVSLNGEPATSYAVQALDSNGDVASSAEPATNSVTLAGLKPGEKYEIRVWANGGKVAPPHASIKVTA